MLKKKYRIFRTESQRVHTCGHVWTRVLLTVILTCVKVF